MKQKYLKTWRGNTVTQRYGNRAKDEIKEGGIPKHSVFLYFYFLSSIIQFLSIAHCKIVSLPQIFIQHLVQQTVLAFAPSSWEVTQSPWNVLGEGGCIPGDLGSCLIVYANTVIYVGSLGSCSSWSTKCLHTQAPVNFRVGNTSFVLLRKVSEESGSQLNTYV